MEQTATGVDSIIAKETWTAEDYKALLAQMLAKGDAPNKFKALTAQLETANPEIKGGAAMKIGIARYTLCRFNEALEAFVAATDNKDRHYFQALCHKQLNQFERAAQEFQLALDRGWDATEIQVQLTELLAVRGLFDQAEKSLAKLQSKIEGTADYFYLKGRIDELVGRTEAAGDAYLQARTIDPKHVAATFRLAYYYDLHGEEDQAIELYKECISHPPMHANALLNLAVLYEDAGKYGQAIQSLRSILTTNPTHPRVRLFLRDAQSSITMFYDEDQAKRIAKRNAVLDIPVTDFELSVRARNCLKKMNIRTLGDLVRTTEPELLSYKNFGETSLKEIKDMLTAKNLRLGQEVEDNADISSLISAPPVPVKVENEGVLSTAIERIEFSGRSRRALEGLKIRTLGDLAAKTEAELLGCRNFGQTSLNEIRQRLAEYGLQLRELSV